MHRAEAAEQKGEALQDKVAGLTAGLASAEARAEAAQQELSGRAVQSAEAIATIASAVRALESSITENAGKASARFNAIDKGLALVQSTTKKSSEDTIEQITSMSTASASATVSLVEEERKRGGELLEEQKVGFCDSNVECKTSLLVSDQVSPCADRCRPWQRQRNKSLSSG